MNKQRLAILVVAALGAAATFLPWAGAWGVSINGIDVGFFGWANLVLYAAVVVLSVLGDRAARLEGGLRTLAILLGIVAGALVVWRLFTPLYGGLGLWLAILAAIALPIVALKVKDKV